MASTLEELIGKKVSVICGDGRCLIGTLKGYDQVQNIVLSETHERAFSLDSPVELIDLGLYIVRGDNLAIIGELDEEEDAKVDLGSVRAEPLKPVMHTAL
mmetsp:Transcript_9001/g.18033  ORF Transcript_9001/g.18033 Transcript_9001/m.18033 type:complete len:100 (-) Transcript_9001:128-427(-)|eukprot:CAMPEP_0182457470 /NCGR_PEP_ID=MMETSP1319-20130603/3037_1 /TAXON_ID=172717 /ORGANISM="Bolidomonas pacifica, Strain RCC208" /LENGTH=99 /DNA_ID=CAMNT_0024655945 /DNA_START=301 /DNA_END=600 /DNA_ORIENTATION=+